MTIHHIKFENDVQLTISTGATISSIDHKYSKRIF